MITDEEIDVLASIAMYNGYLDDIIEWENYLNLKPGFREPPYWSRDTEQGVAQLQVIWMYLVLSIGDYGTSPRGGWIVDDESFKRFIDRAKYYKSLEEE